MLHVAVGVKVLNRNSIAGTKPTKAMIGSLYEEYYDRIVRYIFIRINDQSEAENLGGDVFLKALKSLDSFRGSTDKMRAWLFKIAHNLVVDHLRKISKRKTVSLSDIEVRDKFNTEEVVETKLELKKLSEAIKHLTLAQREVIGLRFFAGLSSSEVGEILGKSSVAVRQMQHDAVEILQKQMYA